MATDKKRSTLKASAFGVRSGRRNSTPTIEVQKDIRLRITLSGDQVYEDCYILSEDSWVNAGIPNIFGEFQFVFGSKRERGNKIIIIHLLEISQVECQL